MRAAFDDIAVVHNEDEVGVFDRREPVRDDKGGAALHELVHRLLNLQLGARVDGACRLVQNEHRGVAHHRAGDRELLALTGGQARFAREHSVVALWQGLNKVVDADGAAGALDLGVRDALLAVDDVFADRALKEPGVLQDHAELLVDIAARDLRRRHVVDADLAALQLVKAHEKVHHRRLARAGRTDDRDLLAGLCLGGEVVDDELVGVLIAEADVTECDLAADVFEALCLRALVGHFVGFEEGEHALARGGGGLHVRERLRHLRQRLSEQAHIDHEGDDVAEGDLAVEHEGRARDTHGDVAEVADEDHERHHEAGEELRFERALAQAAVDLVEGLLRGALAVVGLDDVVARVDLLDVAVHCAEVALLDGEVFLRAGHDEHHQHEADDRGEDGRERHGAVRHEHHDERTDEERHARNEHADALVERLADGVDVVRDETQHVAEGVLVVKPDRDAVDFTRDVRAQTLGDLLRGGRHDEALCEGRDRAHAVDDDERHRDLDDGVEVDAGHEAVRDEVRDLAEPARTHEREHRAERGAGERHEERDLLRGTVGDELCPGALEVGGLFNRADCARTVRTRLLRFSLTDGIFVFRHYASSSFES